MKMEHLRENVVPIVVQCVAQQRQGTR
jgi:hypothetical protein